MTPAERLLPSSLLNFIAGIFAGAGINLLTAVATGPTDVSTHRIEVDAAAWVIAASFAAWAAHVSEGADRRAAALERRVGSALHGDLQQAVMRNEAVKVAGRFWLLVILSVLCVVLAVALIPQLTI